MLTFINRITVVLNYVSVIILLKRKMNTENFKTRQFLINFNA